MTCFIILFHHKILISHEIIFHSIYKKICIFCHFWDFALQIIRERGPYLRWKGNFESCPQSIYSSYASPQTPKHRSEHSNRLPHTFNTLYLFWSSKKNEYWKTFIYGEVFILENVDTFLFLFWPIFIRWILRLFHRVWSCPLNYTLARPVTYTALRTGSRAEARPIAHF